MSWLLEIMLQLTCECKYPFKLVFLFFSNKYPEVKLLHHMVVLCLTFGGTAILFHKWLHQFIFQPTVYQGSLLSTSWLAFTIFCLSDKCHSNRYEGQGSLACCSPRGLKEWDATEQQLNNNRYEVLSHCGFDLHSLLKPSVTIYCLQNRAQTP